MTMAHHLTVEDFKTAKMISSKSVVKLDDLTETEKEQVEILFDNEWEYLADEIEHDINKLFDDDVGMQLCSEGPFRIDTWQVGDTVLLDYMYYPGDNQCGAIFLGETTTRVASNGDMVLYCLKDDSDSLTEEQANAFETVRTAQFNSE